MAEKWEMAELVVGWGWLRVGGVPCLWHASFVLESVKADRDVKRHSLLIFLRVRRDVLSGCTPEFLRCFVMRGGWMPSAPAMGQWDSALWWSSPCTGGTGEILQGDWPGKSWQPARFVLVVGGCVFGLKFGLCLPPVMRCLVSGGEMC